MTQLVADRRDIDFVLHEQFQAEQFSQYEKFTDFRRQTYDMVIKEARKLAIDVILPTYMEGDRQGVRVEGGVVKVPDCYHKPYKLYLEGEWQCMTADPGLGGQGMPHMLAAAVNEYLLGANFTLCNYALFGTAVGNLIAAHGSEKQKEIFVKNLYSGQWSGTMLLTEPQAGSDVGEITTTATKNPDGTYTLNGGKIFITVGDHDLAENIIHPVLARVEGAPPGTKGISIFLVPKIWVNEDGSLGEPNGIECSALEEKMGLHGMSTCSMTLGGKNECRGLLMGEENKGMRIMFHLMNEARLGVGSQAFMYASAAYLHALGYARERIQGRDVMEGMNPKAKSVPIIAHVDVRRMLLNMKCHVNGMRSFVYYLFYCLDKIGTGDAADKDKYGDLLELLTPVIKAYNSDRSFELCAQAMQVFGGYGYTKEYPIELLLRDSKITSIYEGTNGIQSMDFLGRKIPMKNGAVLKAFFDEIRKIIEEAKAVEALKETAQTVEQCMNSVQEATKNLTELLLVMDVNKAFSASYPLLEVYGDFVMAWMLLWRALIAEKALENGSKKRDAAFYKGLVADVQYFAHTVLPVVEGKARAIMNKSGIVADVTDDMFGAR